MRFLFSVTVKRDLEAFRVCQYYWNVLLDIRSCHSKR